MIDLPNEIILLIFRHLSQRSRKQLRLVSKRYASLGALVLIDTIYISPYKPDIEVFTKVTSHPSLRRGVKHVFYDTARFYRGLQVEDYYKMLRCDFKFRSFYMTSRNVTNAAYDDLSNLIFVLESQRDSTNSASARLCHSQSAFRDGHKQYCALAEDMFRLQHGRSRAKNTSWYEQILDGLIKLGPVHSITLDNSFAKHHRVGIEALNDVDSYELGQGHSIWSKCKAQGMLVPPEPTVGLAITKRYGRTIYATVRSDGKRPVSSPLARSWPPQFLQPIIGDSLALTYWNKRDVPGLDDEEYFELDTVLNLLKAAGQLHNVQQLSALRGSFKTDAVAHRVFEMGVLGCPLITEASRHLTRLNLDIAYVPDDDHEFDLNILKSFLENAAGLEEMTIDMQARPNEDDEDGYLKVGELLHSSLEIFPSFAEWQVPNLVTLTLKGISFPYRELAGLLFINLPHLSVLSFVSIQLSEGHWEDVVEGLSRLRKLSHCRIGRSIDLQIIGEFAVEQDIWHRYRNPTVNLGDNIDSYILHGGRHPLLPSGAPNIDSDRYLSRLNKTLQDLWNKHGNAIRKLSLER